MVEVGLQLEIPVKASAIAGRTRPVTFSAPFSAEVINAPMLGKVKLPTLELYDGTTDPEEHLGMYKAQIFF